MKARVRSFPSFGGDTASVLHSTGVHVRPRFQWAPTATPELPLVTPAVALFPDRMRLLNAKVGNCAIASVLSSPATRFPVVQRIFEHNGQRYDEETMAVDALKEIVVALRDRLNTEQEAYEQAFWSGGDAEEPRELKWLVERLETKLKERVREVTKPELAEKVEPPGRKGEQYFGRIPDQAERSGLVAILAAWNQRAGVLRKEVTERLEPMELGRKSLGNAYYDTSGAAFRTEYKKLKRQAAHLKWAFSLADQVARTLEEGDVPLEAFRVVGTGKEVEAVMQLGHDEGSGNGSSPGGRVDPSHIEVIVGNPDNIVKGGGGVIRPLIAVAILSSEGAPIRLIAATNKVKGIYDHYGFRVVAYPERQVERPERHIKIPDVDYPQGFYGPEVLGPLVPRKTTWHRQSSMVLTPEAADQFLAKYPLQEVLDAESIELLTRRLKPALQGGTEKNFSVDLAVSETL